MKGEVSRDGSDLVSVSSSRNTLRGSKRNNATSFEWSERGQLCGGHHTWGMEKRGQRGVGRHGEKGPHPRCGGRECDIDEWHQ